MVDRRTQFRAYLAVLALWTPIVAAGCHAIDLYTPALQPPASSEAEPPRELSMMTLPAYRIAPPDVLWVEATKLAPRLPYRIDAYDVLQIRVLGTLPDLPIDDYYLVDDEGAVELGPAYGVVHIAGMTTDEIASEIARSLSRFIPGPKVSVQLVRSAATQITGEYAVQPDGTVNLGRYGLVHVAGATVSDARLAIQRHLAQYVDGPQLAVDVVGFNSKSYYIVVAGAEVGENVQRFPITGNETVLDAVSQIHGLSGVSSKMMWVARPAPDSDDCEQILPVDYMGIARGGLTATNYQLLPGDRLFIVDDNLVAADNYIDRLTAPVMGLLRIARLGASTTRNMQMLGRDYNRNLGSF